MRISQAAVQVVSKVVPPIPFQREPEHHPKKSDQITFSLLTTPADANSPKYEIKMYKFEDGTVEEWLEFFYGKLS